MKTRTFILIAALFAATALHAQQISVVAPGGATTLYTSLDDAITGAEAGSIIYLSGGGFQIKDGTKITQKLTIIGIGHRSDNDNADGYTNVSGNFSFETGADNSAVLGLYLTGNIFIGLGDVPVNNVLVRYCNANGIRVQNRNCTGIMINQNYLRGESDCKYSPVTFKNNIIAYLAQVDAGTIDHNVFVHPVGYALVDVQGGSLITNNIVMGGIYDSDKFSNNMYDSALGDNTVIVDNWDDVFVGPNNGINPISNFALKGSLGKNAGTDGTDIGIYGGTGFSNSALPPGPRIVDKKVSEQTDANGNLRVEIKVSAQ
jgi:hypothetical protein